MITAVPDTGQRSRLKDIHNAYAYGANLGAAEMAGTYAARSADGAVNFVIWVAGMIDGALLG
jgi:hypothetical protein